MFHAFCGLPRSGTTILNAIINQHPNIYMPFQSPLLELIYRNYFVWLEDNLQLEVSDNKIHHIQVPFVRNMILSFINTCTDKKIFIDKHWNWFNPNNQLIYEKLYNKKIKLLSFERKREDIIESFRKIDPNNLEERIKKLDLMLYVKNWFFSENPQNILIIDYEQWISKPRETLNNIENWFEVEPFQYDLSNLVLDTTITDSILQNNKMHILRPMINT